MNKFKLILTICIVTVLIFTMTVATFANDPLTEGGEELVRLKDWRIPNGLDWDAVFDYLSDSQWEQVRFYKNGICFKVIINNSLETKGYYENIYNANDRIIPDFNEEETYRAIVTNFDYIIMPYSIWTSVTNESDFSDEDIIRLEGNNSILGVFSAVPAFIVNAVNSATGIFWANGALTMLGILAIIAVAFGVCLLVVSLITRFMGFRG